MADPDLAKITPGATFNPAHWLEVTSLNHGPGGTWGDSTNLHETLSFSPLSSENPRQAFKAGDTSIPAPLKRLFAGLSSCEPKT